jgi:single-stranded DNA-binding protein
MSWNIGEQRYPQVATFWKIAEEKDNYAVVSLGTSSKDKEKNWHNSNWSFVKFVGNAHKGLDALKEGDKIIIKSGKIDRDAWVDKEGKKQYPKNEKITVFAWEPYVPEQRESGGMDTPPVVEENTDELPF